MGASETYTATWPAEPGSPSARTETPSTGDSIGRTQPDGRYDAGLFSSELPRQSRRLSTLLAYIATDRDDRSNNS